MQISHVELKIQNGLSQKIDVVELKNMELQLSEEDQTLRKMQFHESKKIVDEDKHQLIIGVGSSTTETIPKIEELLEVLWLNKKAHIAFLAIDVGIYRESSVFLKYFEKNNENMVKKDNVSIQNLCQNTKQGIFYIVNKTKEKENGWFEWVKNQSKTAQINTMKGTPPTLSLYVPISFQNNHLKQYQEYIELFKYQKWMVVQFGMQPSTTKWGSIQKIIVNYIDIKKENFSTLNPYIRLCIEDPLPDDKLPKKRITWGYAEESYKKYYDEVIKHLKDAYNYTVVMKDIETSETSTTISSKKLTRK